MHALPVSSHPISKGSHRHLITAGPKRTLRSAIDLELRMGKEDSHRSVCWYQHQFETRKKAVSVEPPNTSTSVCEFDASAHTELVCVCVCACVYI
jgi:hypothetical protein